MAKLKIESENSGAKLKKLCKKVYKLLGQKENLKADVIVVDPPRKGCDAELVKTITRDFAPERVVYVSCDPATLARDCKLFKEMGYDTQKCATFDMFPRTGHVESVVILVKM